MLRKPLSFTAEDIEWIRIGLAARWSRILLDRNTSVRARRQRAFGYGLWDLESGRALRTLEGHAASVTGVAVTADGKRAVSASSDQTLKAP